MDVFECIRTRRSIRRYKSSPVEWEKIGRILEAGKAAPSAGNLQNWKFIVILDPAVRKRIAEICLKQEWMAEAPVHIIIVAEPEKGKWFYGLRGEKLYTVQGCSAAAQNMLLAAHSLGLGSCWVGAFDEESLRSAVFMPQEVRPQAVITIGYPDEVVPEPPEFTLENVMFFRNYGGQPHRIKELNEYTVDWGQSLDNTLRKGVNKLRDLKKRLQKK